MVLKEMLPPNCIYTPSDVWQRHPDIVVADLNKGEFPAGTYDTVVMLGVVQYLEDPLAAFRKSRQSAKSLIFSYDFHPVLTRRSILHMEKQGQLNHLRLPETESLLRIAGWTIEKRQSLARWRHLFRHEDVILCR
jgi:hypothetical protein